LTLATGDRIVAVIKRVGMGLRRNVKRKRLASWIGVQRRRNHGGGLGTLE
jgi:hypothetical protein